MNKLIVFFILFISPIVYSQTVLLFSVDMKASDKSIVINFKDANAKQEFIDVIAKSGSFNPNGTDTKDDFVKAEIEQAFADAIARVRTQVILEAAAKTVPIDDLPKKKPAAGTEPIKVEAQKVKPAVKKKD